MEKKQSSHCRSHGSTHEDPKGAARKLLERHGSTHEDPKGAARKLLERSSEFSKVAGYNINTQKSLAFLYTNNEISEKEVKESIPFTIATKRIKHLGINLPKETKELYSETYETRTKESRQHRERFHIPGLEESILCK